MNQIGLKSLVFISAIILLHNASILYCQHNEEALEGRNSNGIFIERLTISDTSLIYFPVNSFLDTVNLFGQEKDIKFYERRKKSDSIKNSIYSNNLFALNEPKLFKGYNYEAYRFTWLRANHDPISVRIENRNDEIYLFFKRTSVSDAQHFGQLTNNDTIFLDFKVWEAFLNKIEKNNFWKIPTIEKSEVVVKGRGVSKWILEGKANEEYHLVYRTNALNKDIGDICMYFINLTGLKIRTRNLY